MKVRKIAALAVGAAMVGATLGYASAAMPEKEFFVKDGVITQAEVAAEDIPYPSGTATQQGGLWNITTKDKDINPFVFTVEDALTWEFVKPEKYTDHEDEVRTFSGGQFLDYTVNITEVKFNPEKWKEYDDSSDDYYALPPKSIDLVIDPQDIQVTIDFKVGTYVDPDYDNTKAGMPYGITLVDDWPGDDLRKGAKAGDTIDLFGKELKLVDVNKSGTVLGSDYVVVVGEAYDPEYLKNGETYTFGEYKVTPVDIDVYEDKALIQVKGSEGEELVILDADDPQKKSEILFDGGIRVTLLDTFVGIEGNLIAYVQVETNLKGYKETVKDFIPGWTAEFVVNNTLLDKIVLYNNEKLTGPEIELFDMYKIYYDYIEYTDEAEDGTDYYGAIAYLRIDPKEPEWSTTEVEIGDELDDYAIDSVKTEKVKTIEITEITEPITVLDEEVDLNAVDSNLILVGGPVANAITKYLVDQGLSTVDWENSDGEFEYLEDVFGEYDVLIVAGKDRYATREAAKELMQYLAAL